MILRVCQNPKITTTAVEVSVSSVGGESDAVGDVAAGRGRLVAFREEFYLSLVKRRDALFELCDAVLCASGPVTSLPELSLEPVHRRGHGSTYAALSAGRVEVMRLCRSLAGLTLPRSSGGQLRLAVDVTPWPRPDAECSPGPGALSPAVPL
jgi:hypothetical protein